jgi:two-component system, cell cycle response regulator DivK
MIYSRPVVSAPFILVVDDVADGREMLTEYLRFRGFRVVAADNGVAALEIARRERPRVILMDLAMPGVDGWNATRQLKADPRTKHIIVVAVTAHALTGDEAIAKNAGCDAFVAKPYELVQLADALQILMRWGRRGLKPFATASKMMNRTTAEAN